MNAERSGQNSNGRVADIRKAEIETRMRGKKRKSEKALRNFEII